jgi:hypothetical protein
LTLDEVAVPIERADVYWNSELLALGQAPFGASVASRSRPLHVYGDSALLGSNTVPA